MSYGPLVFSPQNYDCLVSRKWSMNISWNELKTYKVENTKDVKNSWYGQDYMNNQAFVIVWIYFIFAIFKKVLLLCLDLPLKIIVSCIFSYVRLTLFWLSVFLEEEIHYMVNSCPGIINLPHMSEYFILRTYSVPWVTTRPGFNQYRESSLFVLCHR